MTAMASSGPIPGSVPSSRPRRWMPWLLGLIGALALLLVLALLFAGSIAADRLASLGGELGAMILGPTGREGLLGQVLTGYDGDRDVGSIAGTTAVGAGMALGILPEPNYGTVAVIETKLPGLRDHLTLPVTHTGLLVSPEVAAQTAYFLRHGRFNRAPPAA